MASAASALTEKGICVFCVTEIPPNTRLIKLDCNHEIHEKCFESLKDYYCNGRFYYCPFDYKKISGHIHIYIRSDGIDSKDGIICAIRKDSKSSMNTLDLPGPVDRIQWVALRSLAQIPH